MILYIIYSLLLISFKSSKIWSSIPLYNNISRLFFFPFSLSTYLFLLLLLTFFFLSSPTIITLSLRLLINQFLIATTILTTIKNHTLILTYINSIWYYINIISLYLNICFLNSLFLCFLISFLLFINVYF